MPVIGGNNPTVNVTLPVPTPMAKKPKAPAPAQPAPQPVPANPDSGQQPSPQGMAPQQPAMPQPQPHAIIMPWTPADQPKKKLPRKSLRMAKRKYALNEGYQGEHTAPDSTSGAPLHDVTANGIYPEDVYTHNGLRYYGTGDDAADANMHAKINRLRNKPKQMILIYRAIPHGLKGAKINRGDWVTLSKEYARDHGRSALNGKYRILSKIANAQDVFTNGDSWHEWGYDPVQGREQKPEQMSRKYAAGDDLSMDFDSMGEDELPKQPLQRPAPSEDITGRTRKQILQQILEAAKRGHYDPSGMTPRDYIGEMEGKQDVPQFGGDVWLSDPEDEEDEPKQYTRLIYPNPEQ